MKETLRIFDHKNSFANCLDLGNLIIDQSSHCDFIVKPHLHGRVLAARIDILPFFFLKSPRSLTRRKTHVRFCLRDIARHAPQKIKSRQSLTRERFYRDARIWLQLAEVTYTLRLRASDSHKIESAEESLSYWFTYTVRDSFKALLAGFEFTKANSRESTSNAPLVSFCV